jgi:SAM-dependent methyltransferase
MLTSSELRDEVIRLGPWHIDIEITPEVSTATFLEAPPGTYSDDFGQITFHKPHDGFLRRLHRAFPNGLEGRSVLDCACNCGAYLFYAKEAGAGRCLGFDIREHWIRQARFLAEHRELPSDDMRFEVSDLYELPALQPGRFDITLFLGIFYHLPDPVTGLKIAADLTDEVMIVNTATRAGFADGLLVPDHERAERLMSGTYGLCWFPTGPQLLAGILKWLGFAEVRCSIWRHAPRQRDELDRLEVIASRTPGFFAAWDAARPPGIEGVREVIETHTPPGATVLTVAAGEELGELHSRQVVPFALDDGDDLARLDQLRSEGAGFLVAYGDGLAQLGARPALAARLDASGRLADDSDCLIYTLRGSQW